MEQVKQEIKAGRRKPGDRRELSKQALVLRKVCL